MLSGLLCYAIKSVLERSVLQSVILQSFSAWRKARKEGGSGVVVQDIKIIDKYFEKKQTIMVTHTGQNTDTPQRLIWLKNKQTKNCRPCVNLFLKYNQEADLFFNFDIYFSWLLADAMALSVPLPVLHRLFHLCWEDRCCWTASRITCSVSQSMFYIRGIHVYFDSLRDC